ncbi:type II secretion system protein [Candidatus Nomurabacteria bacterium]|nr:type II secretion system protein [Candidatus Nomurabacteria bacterium]
MKKIHQRQQGFTLIEMIVSLAVFSVVVTIAVGALLSLIATNLQLQAEQSVMTNLSFALDSMTREIRTGTNYYCDNKNSATGNKNIYNGDKDLDSILEVNDTKNCPFGKGENTVFNGVAFIESGESITGDTGKRILYYFDKDEKSIYRRIGSQKAQSIISSGIEIDDAEFFVSGSDRLADALGNLDGYVDQPSVTIFIEAHEKSDTLPTKTYRIQTTVTQRTLDI